MSAERTMDVLVACVVAAFAITVEPAHASKGVWEEYEKIVRSSENIGALGPTLLGDQINIQNGALSFSVTDASLKGNNALPVAFGRTFKTNTVGGAMKGTLTSGNQMDGALGDWEIDLPHIGGVFSQAAGWINSTNGKAAQRCSVANASEARPPNQSVGSSYFTAEEYWHGTRISVPGRGAQALLVMNASSPRPTGSSAYWVTSDFTSISCLPTILNGSGEGFIATTPDGTRYWFNWMAGAYEQELTKQRTSTVGYDHLPRRRLGLYASRMEDRFGNWVTYTYTNAASSPVRLSEINASDGRRITVAYNGSGFVQSVTANARTWSYGYSGGTAGSLTSVVLPDGSAWSIDLGTFQRLSIRYYQGEPGEQWRSCGQPGDIVPQTYVGRVTHPSGAVGQFTLEPRRFVRDGVTSYYPQNCALGNPNDSNDDSEWYPTAWDSYALISKNLTGPGLPAATWAYTYNSGYNTDVAGPGTYHRYTYGNVFRQNEAKLLKVEQGANATQILSIEDYTYELAQSGMPYPTPLGASPQIRSDDFTEEYPRPERQRVITRDGTTFSSYVNSFDAFVRPGSVGKWSSLGYGKTDVTEYHDDYGKWVIGQVKRQYNADTGIVMSQTDYDANALPWKTYAFGKLQQTLGYYADGTLATVTDGRNYTTTLSNWYRGIPRTIQHPDGTIESASVNDNGWITSVVDENGYSTGYGYDAMGRLASIVYPIGDAVAYQDTTSVFQQVGWDEYGIPAGHWRQTVTTGNARKVTYFDAMWRPLVQEFYDQANVNATLSQSVKRYDASGKLAFQSYPLRFLSNYATVTAGTRTSYDPLERVTRVEQDSELGVLATTTEYLSGFQTRVTNPRGLQTTNGYQAYEQPSYDLLRSSVQPEGKVIEVFRHARLGNPEQVRQRNADGSLQQSRYFVYDGYRQLCKTIEPEVGSTVMEYDAAGNLAWTASGHALPDTGSCNTAEGYWWGRRVDRSYDARNRLKTLVFPDGNGNQTWTYAPDGLPQQIVTANDGGSTQAINYYTYNRRRLLTGESVEQPGWYSWGIGYGYDANGNLASQVFSPTGSSIDYAPNALGQATRAGTYAQNVTYHPNGGIAQFTYGNGIVHTMAQNARQLPARSTDSGSVLDYDYQYDATGNVTYIGDLVQGSGYSRWMSYDGLDRLTAAGSASFGGDHWHRFTYDALDNLKSWKLAGVKDYANYYYESGTNRLTNIQNSVGASVVGLGYDVQGNLANKNGQTYTFDYGNRLRGATNQESYRYDGLGRRVLAWSPTQGSILSQYTQSGQLIFQQNQRLNKNIDHIYLAGSLVALREYNYGTGVWATRYQHTDALGSPVAISNEAGQVVDRTQHEPFGAVINKPAADGVGYTGHVQDAATGLTYMQQRYYDPAIGRFLSIDPVTADGSTGGNFNRYWYANNNPYRFTDPDGRLAGRPGDRGALYVNEGMSGFNVNSAAALGMANIPRSWRIEDSMWAQTRFNPKTALAQEEKKITGSGLESGGLVQIKRSQVSLLRL